MNVKDKVVIITGGGSGIGLAAARAFAHGQANVLITGRRGHALEEIASSVTLLGRRGVPEDVVRWIVTLASRDADWVTGQVLGIDGGFTLV